MALALLLFIWLMELKHKHIKQTTTPAKLQTYDDRITHRITRKITHKIVGFCIDIGLNPL
ncbi:hypothetical protein Hanom_Chr11g00980631 [Helianthus anomalus]